MLRTLSTMAVLAWCAMLTGCAAETTTSLDTTAPGAAGESAGAAQPFAVRLGGDATAETAIPAIVAAGRDQLIAVCEQGYSPSAENPTGYRAITALGGGGLGLLCAVI